ncbi:MAG: hypothetical protein K2M94_06360 [Paramuribaculum sp.]|nr:hypothetical protein [Paramuribaculum sp.]
MKHFLLLVCSCAVFSQASYADICLTSRHNSLRGGDDLRYCSVGYTDTVSAGDNRIWDLSTCSLNKDYRLFIESMSDKNDTLACVMNRTKYHFIQHGDSIIGRGFENNQSDMFYTYGEILLSFPVRFGQFYNGTAAGSGRHVDRWTQSAIARYTVVADTRGFLITPDNDTICDVLRIRTFREIHNTLTPVNACDNDCQRDSMTVYQTQSRIYAPGYRYPLVISEMIKSESGEMLSVKTYYCSPVSMAALDDVVNEEVRENVLVLKEYAEKSLAFRQMTDGSESYDYSNIEYQFSQDKANGKVTFTYTVNSPADVEFILADVYGIVYGTEFKHSMPGETYTVSFDYSTLPYSAAYGVSISIGDERYSEKIYR